MNVKQAYDVYQIPPNLQKHMLRVAALSEILSKHWTGGLIDAKSLIMACIFHDMANIIKFNFNKPLLFTDEAKDAEYWKSVQKEFIDKYGAGIHQATLSIGKELGLSQPVLDLIKNLEWNNTMDVLKTKDFSSALAIYCDMRIGPHGIMSLQDRLSDLQTRNKTHDFTFIKNAAILLESTLQKHLSIDVNSIADAQLNKRFDSLLEVEI